MHHQWRARELGCGGGNCGRWKARPDSPAVSLWNFFDGSSHLIAQISAGIHDPICALPQHHSLTIRVVVILILRKSNKIKKHTACGGETP